jgi:hypothetical protein
MSRIQKCGQRIVDIAKVQNQLRRTILWPLRFLSRFIKSALGVLLPQCLSANTAVGMAINECVLIAENRPLSVDARLITLSENRSYD